MVEHLGNVRVSFNSDGQDHPVLMQKDAYYPFRMGMDGLSYDNSNDNNYLQNGKELEEDHDLNQYQYGACFYDPQLGRWHAIDPADEFPSLYCYGSKNPINGIDPDGLKWVDSSGQIIQFDKLGITVNGKDNTMAANTLADYNVLDFWVNAQGGALTKHYFSTAALYEVKEAINEATFTLYKDKKSLTATIKGNTSPDTYDYTTAKAGTYNVRWWKYDGRYASRQFEKGGEVPTYNPNSKHAGRYVANQIYDHRGNSGFMKLRKTGKHDERVPISVGCMTFGCGAVSVALYNKFMGNIKKSWDNGRFVLRRNQVMEKSIALIIMISCFLGLFCNCKNVEGNIYFMKLHESDHLYNLLYFETDSTYVIYIYETTITYYGNYSVKNDIIHFYNEHTLDGESTEESEYKLIIAIKDGAISKIGGFEEIAGFSGKKELMFALDSRDDMVENKVIDKVYDMNKKDCKLK